MAASQKSMEGGQPIVASRFVQWQLFGVTRLIRSSKTFKRGISLVAVVSSRQEVLTISTGEAANCLEAVAPTHEPLTKLHTGKREYVPQSMLGNLHEQQHPSVSFRSDCCFVDSEV